MPDSRVLAPPGSDPTGRGRAPRWSRLLRRRPDQRFLTPEELERARGRIRHVIVLMLENRSFDHLFGYLNHPDKSRFEGLDDEERARRTANPFDVERPGGVGEPVTVSPAAEPVLELDPPHGHVSAKLQMNGNRWRDFKMNGFVTAYARKLDGKEHLPVIHWKRIKAVAVLLSPVLAAAAHDLARRAVLGGWAGLLGWWVPSAGVVVATIAVLQVDRLPGRSRRQLAVPALVVTTVLGAAASGIWRWAAVSRRGLVSWTAATAVVGLALVARQRRAATQRARVPPEKLHDASTRVMRCMAPDKIPVLGELAREFAVCTRWHCSVPGATWPNRNFAHAATSEEAVDIEAGFYDAPTIFQLLDEQHPPERGSKGPYRTWRIYHHDAPQLYAFDKLWKEGLARNWFDVSRLLADIASDELAMYSFVEPCHTGSRSNSQHPGNNEKPSGGSSDFERGEDLVAAIYQALQQKPEVFDRTLFLVTYDEHGGLYDREPPPRTVHPQPGRYVRRSHRQDLTRRLVAFFVEYRYGNARFDFRCLGPRVPAVVISPWVRRARIDDTLYEHSSIVASVRLLFAPDRKPLTRRDGRANSFLRLVAESEGRRPVAPLAGRGGQPPPAPPSVAVPLDYAGPGAAAGEARATLGDRLEDQLAVLDRRVARELDARAEAETAEERELPTTGRFKRYAERQRS